MVHHKGKTHFNADALSHYPATVVMIAVMHTQLLMLFVQWLYEWYSRSHQDIRNHQMKVGLIGSIFQAKIDGAKPTVEIVTLSIASWYTYEMSC